MVAHNDPLGQRQATFGLGVNEFFPADLVPDNESVRLENAEIHKTGALRPRGGMSGAVTLATLSGDGRPRLMRVFEGKGHSPTKVSVIQTSDTTSALFVEDSFGGLLSFGIPHSVGDTVELVQILDRIYILEPGNAPLYWQWGNVQVQTDGAGSTAFPQCRSATFFKGRAWAGQSDGDLLFFSLTLGAEPYETFLKRSEDADLETISTSRLAAEDRAAASADVSEAANRALINASRDTRLRASRERAADQNDFLIYEREREDIELTFGITLPELQPVIQTEAQKPSVAFGQFVWHEDFQAFRMATGRIVSLLPFRNDVILIFTNRGIELLEPDSCDVLESRRVTVSNVVGCGAAQSIQVVGEDVMFMDQEGNIRSVAQTQLAESQGVAAVPLSQKIQRVIDRQNKQYLSASRSVLFDGVYYIAMPMDGARVPTEVWGYVVRDRSWVGPYTIGPTRSIHGFSVVRLEGDISRLYALIKDGSIVRSVRFLDGRFDLDTAITTEWRSKNFVMNQPTTRKTWSSIDMEARVLKQLSINPSVFELSVRGEEGAWLTLALLTLGTNASPQFLNLGNGTFGLTLPFALVPDNRQHLKTALTSIIPRSYGCQIRIKETGPTTNDRDWEILSLVLWGLVDPAEFQE